MNSVQLRNDLSFCIPPDYETGVFACDELDCVTTSKFAIVLNSEDSTQPGLHWLALFKEANSDIVERWDSYSMPINFYSPVIKNFMISKAKYEKHSINQFQSNYSIVCGEFCLYFLANRTLGYSYEDIVSKFDLHDLERNDALVTNFVKINFNLPTMTQSQARFVKTGTIQCCKYKCKLLCNKS